MKIIYCIAGTCHSGGMERVLANKANYLVEKGHEIVIITTDQHGRVPFFSLNNKIRCFDLGINYEDNNGKSFLNKLIHYPFKQYLHKKRLKSVLLRERADITVCMFNNDASFITDINDGSAKLLEIHFSKFKRLQYNRKGIWRLADLWRSMRDERVVRKFDKFIVLTEEDKKLWGEIKNIEVIPNAITVIPKETSTLENQRVLAVGRFTFQKGFDRLVEAWRIISNQFPDWKLDIVGDGEEYDKLVALIKQYRLDNSVSLIQAQKDLSSKYLGASIYAMTSHYEGLPMVLLEAQSYGLPIVSFDCKCGPKDIIEDGENGFLVDDGNVLEFAKRIGELMENASLRKKMGNKAYKSSIRFNEDIIMNQWIQTFKSLMNR